MIVKAIAEWFQSIPNVIWSGVIGSVIAASITLLGVFLSNRGNNHRLRIQLQHDSAQKAKERIFNLRKEVSLRAAEEIVSVQNHVTSLPFFTSNEKAPLEAFSALFAALSALRLVAGRKTVATSDQMIDHLSRVKLAVLEASEPLISVRANLESLEKHLDELTGDQIRINSRMKQLNESVEPDLRQLEILQLSFDAQIEEYQKYSAKASELRILFTEEAEKLSNLIAKEVPSIIELNTRTMEAIRRDLGTED